MTDSGSFVCLFYFNNAVFDHNLSKKNVSKKPFHPIETLNLIISERKIKTNFMKLVNKERYTDRVNWWLNEDIVDLSYLIWPDISIDKNHESIIEHKNKIFIKMFVIIIR